EEQIFPLETWGKDYIAARNPQRESEAMRWRIIGSKDNTKVDFSPPTSLGNSVTLDAGEMVEFDDSGDFSISADEPILVAGFMLGCKSNGMNNNCKGDPYMVLMVPSEQYKSDYVFLIDNSYNEDFAKLIRPSGAAVEVGCLGVVPENRWTAVGNSGYDVAVVDMNPGEANCTTGTNEASSDEKFGIIVSGQDVAASYAYPGGLGLAVINPQ
ncbi:MAG: IgGFc-binding protein, partial [Nannocystaceae bacterium]